MELVFFVDFGRYVIFCNRFFLISKNLILRCGQRTGISSRPKSFYRSIEKETVESSGNDAIEIVQFVGFMFYKDAVVVEERPVVGGCGAVDERAAVSGSQQVSEFFVCVSECWGG